MDKRNGSALLSALFIMTLVAIAATAMSTRLQLDIYRTRLTINSDKLYLASQAVTFWAMDALSKKNTTLVSTSSEGRLLTFPKELQQIYPGIATAGSLYDLQARFNINNLQEKAYRPMFLKLLEKILPESNNLQSRLLTEATIAWITPYQPGKGRDKFLDDYLKQKPPYLPAYQPMQSISEFRLIDGVSAQIYQTISPYITTLPEITPININTAPKTILMLLGNGLSEWQANELIQARGMDGIDNLNDIGLILQKLDIPPDQITTESQYYLSLARTSTETLTLTNYTIIKRTKDKKGNISVNIIHESLNTL